MLAEEARLRAKPKSRLLVDGIAQDCDKRPANFVCTAWTHGAFLVIAIRKKGRCLAPAFAAGLVLPVWSYKT
jgi:hypothetical protein